MLFMVPLFLDMLSVYILSVILHKRAYMRKKVLRTGKKTPEHFSKHFQQQQQKMNTVDLRKVSCS